MGSPEAVCVIECEAVKICQACNDYLARLVMACGAPPPPPPTRQHWKDGMEALVLGKGHKTTTRSEQMRLKQCNTGMTCKVLSVLTACFQLPSTMLQYRCKFEVSACTAWHRTAQHGLTTEQLAEKHMIRGPHGMTVLLNKPTWQHLL